MARKTKWRAVVEALVGEDVDFHPNVWDLGAKKA